jgi:hypothetical protein|tara:strand:- start:1627 stop:1803 length:177 start_codon:yes stop_codon:yes gene_type:complete
MDTITVDKKIFSEIAQQIEDLSLKIESIELASNPKLMNSLKKSEEQIKKGDVVDFDDL